MHNYSVYIGCAYGVAFILLILYVRLVFLEHSKALKILDRSIT